MYKTRFSQIRQKQQSGIYNKLISNHVGCFKNGLFVLQGHICELLSAKSNVWPCTLNGWVTDISYQVLWFWKYSLNFFFKFDHILGLFCIFLGPLGLFFGPLGLFFGPLGLFLESGSGSKNIFGTYLCSQSPLVLEVQPYLFSFTSAKFGAFFALCSYLWVWGQVHQNFLGLTFVEYQLWFWRYSPIFLFLVRPDLGLFLGSGSKTFWDRLT